MPPLFLPRIVCFLVCISSSMHEFEIIPIGIKSTDFESYCVSWISNPIDVAKKNDVSANAPREFSEGSSLFVSDCR